MRTLKSVSLLVLVTVLLASFVAAQRATAALPSTSSAGAVPNLISYNGVLNDNAGAAVGVTFLIYIDERGGAPLWMETQNVTPDHTGHYTVQLGSTTAQGLPSSIFQNGEARWLAVQLAGESEQPRVLLVAVPYAMKAQDAETVGGLPASAFLLAPIANAAAAQSNVPAVGAAPSSAPPPTSSDVTTSGGTVNALPLFTTANNVQNSILTQTSTTAINVGGKLNLPATGAATASKGFTSRPLDFVASSYNSSTKASVPQTFQWQAEQANNNTANPSAILTLLYGSGTTAPAETGLRIGPKGIISFAPGQTFPGGSGTITGVTAGTGLAGGGTSGAVTLNVDSSKVPLLASANTFTGNNNFNGGLSATSSGLNTIVSSTSGPGNTGIWGMATATSGGSSGVYGTTQDPTGAGVLGVNESAGGLAALSGGVVGISNVPSPYVNGVLGEASYGYGVSGVATGPSATAVEALGFSPASGSGRYGSLGVLVYGGNGDPINSTEGGIGVAVYGGAGGETGGAGILTYGGFGPASAGDGIDAYGYTSETSGSDGKGGNFVGGGGHAYGDGIYAESGANSASAWAGDFNGDVNIVGTLYGGNAALKIDDPLDPANKYLYHSSVESPDMMNLYNGNVTTDSSGLATITLPEWFETLNRDFRYQLTVIGQFAQAIIANKIENHQFRIRTSLPNVEVSWQVTGIRQDAWANAHRIPVEEEKEARLKGYYIHPELYGAPREKQIEWARHPETMKKMQQHRQLMKEKPAGMPQFAALPHITTK